MRVSVVCTDLDGTLLDLDGRICPQARAGLRRLTDLGIPVCVLTSKTAAELVPLLRLLELPYPASFENGAGVLFPDGSTQLFDGAVPVQALEQIAKDIRSQTAAPLRMLCELTDQELEQLTELPLSDLPAVRQRLATAPLVVDEQWDRVLIDALPSEKGVTAVRGNRFLHLQGSHNKGTALGRVLAAVACPPGLIVACGDSPNDIPMLAAAQIQVVIPSARGPHSSLMERFPGAVVPPYPHGKGWAAAVNTLLDGKMEYEERNPA